MRDTSGSGVLGKTVGDDSPMCKLLWQDAIDTIYSSLVFNSSCVMLNPHYNVQHVCKYKDARSLLVQAD